MSSLWSFVSCAVLVMFAFLAWIPLGVAQRTAKSQPHVVVIGVNGMELDVILPLLLHGKMPNLSSVIKKGSYGKLRTLSAPNCPRVYSTLFTSTTPEEHGVTGFVVGGITANPNMLKEGPIWSVLSKKGVRVGLAPVREPKIYGGRPGGVPGQYAAFYKVLGVVLKHVDDNTYVIIVSDHGIKPLREFEETDPHAHMDHEKTTPVIAKHDFADGDEVPGSFIAMGPGIKRDQRLMGFAASVYDTAPTILHIYGIEPPK